MEPMRWLCHDCFHGMQPADTAGGIVVVIDVLRASTTIATALAAGASAIFAAATAAEALAAARLAGRGAGTCLLGGERGGLRIEGFDLGNSPAEYTPRRVAGKRIVTTTTNGTAAIAACPAAREILVGAIVNRRAVAAAAVAAAATTDPPAAIHLVCAGTDGEPTAEDLLGAGAILDAAGALPPLEIDAPAARALEAWRHALAGASDPGAVLEAALAGSQGGRNLLAIGMGADIPIAAAVDALTVVPRRDDRDGWFRAGA